MNENYGKRNTNLLLILFSILFLLSFTFTPATTTFLNYIDAATDNFDNDPSDSIIRCSLLGECNGTNNIDIIIGTSTPDRIFAKEGNDLVQGGLLSDEIHGDEGDDTLQGGEGSDIIFGEDGNDYLFADSPNSAISLLVNSQTLVLEDSIGREFQLQDPVLQVIEQEDLLSKISQELRNPRIPQNLVSNVSILIHPFNANNNKLQTTVPQIDNSDNNVQLSGGNGDDHIFGGSGDDILKGGPGKDFFDCNEGMDTVVDYNSKEDTVSINCEEI
ncbi:MAG: hypothetical protein AB7F53_02920 [Nitrososphaeraceae archaeon]